MHSEAQKDQFAKQANLMLLEGADREYLTRAEVETFCPLIDTRNGRFPVIGGFLQRRGGTARHDAVAWGYARAASELGVDIIEHCEATGFSICDGKVTAVSTSRGEVRAGKVLLAVAGHSSRLAAKAGFRLPLETHALQAFVTESIKPLIDCVVTYGAGAFYVSQFDKGGWVFGGGTDGWNSYAQRGRLSGRRGSACRRPYADAVAVAAPCAAPMGRREDMTMGTMRRSSRKTPVADLYLTRLVLWRLQGGADRRCRNCPSRREGRAAPTRRASGIEPVCRRPHHR